MKIGFLHIGPPKHGVCRYGRLLAMEARRQANITVIEAEVILGRNQDRNRRLLLQAAHTLSDADVIHFQFNKFGRDLWGGGWAQIHHLRLFMDHCSAPLVVTLHDVFYPPYRLTNVFKQARSKLRAGVLSEGEPTANVPPPFPSTPPSASLPHSPKRSRWQKASGFVQSILNGWFGAEAIALQAIVRRAAMVLVCTHEEAKRVADRIDRHKLQVIPHFVEERSIRVPASEARRILGLEGVKVVTLLGFIYPPKGHDILVEAMPALPEDVMVVFAGSAGSSDYAAYVNRLSASAKANGVAHRLRITGYLSEAELELYLQATDLAVCPFTRFSASGSLSTWISVDRPILASDLPQIAEYNQLEPNAIHLFRPCTATALANAIQQRLQQEHQQDALAVAQLRQKLSISVILNQHVVHYRQLANNRSTAIVPHV